MIMYDPHPYIADFLILSDKCYFNVFLCTVGKYVENEPNYISILGTNFHVTDESEIEN